MEQIYNALKNEIVKTLPEFLAEISDDKTPLPAIQEKNVVFGVVDVTRLSGKVTVAIIPNTQAEEEFDLDDYNQSSKFLVTFIITGDKYDVLVRQMCRYAAAFRKMILLDGSLDGEVFDTQIGERTFDVDAGTVSGTLTAVEIEITVFTTDEE